MLDAAVAALSPSELRARLGSLAAIAGIRRYRLTEGRASGVEIAEIRTGTGLRLEVLLSRGMDIGPVDLGGIPIAWQSPTGPSSPHLHDPHGLGWLRGFHGGLLTGCGLRHAGSPSADGAEALGLHGHLSNTPAEQIATTDAWVGDRRVFEVRGTVREARVLGESLRMDRTISTSLGSNRISVNDIVSNDGYEPTPHMMLYHLNLGFPIVSEASRLVAPIRQTTPRDGDAAAGIDRARVFEAPVPGASEQVFYHELAAGDDGWVECGIVRDAPGPLGVAVRYRAVELPRFVEWKLMRSGSYVVGLEPANCLVEGMAAERAAGRLVILEPGDSLTYRLEIRVLTSHEEIRALEHSVVAAAAGDVATVKET